MSTWKLYAAAACAGLVIVWLALQSPPRPPDALIFECMKDYNYNSPECRALR